MVAVASACGGTSTSYPGADPKTWASGVCSLLAGADEATARPFREAQAELQSFTTFESRRVRRLVVRAASQVVRVDEEIVAKYDAIGAPAVEDGPAIQRTFRATLVRLRDFALDARERARTLPVDTTEHFLAAFQVFSTDLNERGRDLSRDLSREISTNLGRFDAPELGEAFDNEPTCKTL